MRPEHQPSGDPCSKCGLPEYKHRKRRQRSEYYRNYDRESSTVAIDGEGVTIDGKHRYTYLAASTATKDLGAIHNPDGLETTAIFDFLLSLPKRSLKVGYGLGYDKTLWVRDMPNSMIWALARPERRMRDGRPVPIRWEGYRVNMIHRRFTVGRGERTCTVWDFIGFFQRTFVRSLKDWGVGTAEELERIQAMKDQRGNFAELSTEDVHAYCRAECRLMAQLADRLIEAHHAADLSLRSYYGAGSTASVLLDRYGARSQRATFPDAMLGPVDCAFFGGRFEVARIGPVSNHVHGYDIASAYPHVISQLPCFEHGKWTYGKPRQDELEGADAALCQYRLPLSDSCISPVTSAYGIELASTMSWGPLPFRRKDGNIVYPVSSGGGWVWRDEFLAAQKFADNVEIVSAWLYHTDCDCGRPFAGFEGEFAKRLAWGKEGRGQVLKLGMNSCYGKRAQRTGSMVYRCMVAAGIITSTTRARLLALMTLDREAVLSVATDGLMASRKLPVETASKVLGCWEYKSMPSGVFMLRPGFEFSLGFKDEDSESVKARGAGKKIVAQHRRQIIEQWERSPAESFTLTGRSLFRGLKTSITASRRGWKRKNYGQWVDAPFVISYAPTPKRPAMTADYRLLTWALDDSEQSAPYKGGDSALIKALQDLRTIEDEQPDCESGMEVELDAGL